MKQFKLTSDISVPALGFGTWQLNGVECVEAVSKALETGYRHIDTADVYGNHQEVAKSLKRSGIPREEIFITTKVWRTNLHPEDVLESGHRFLKELGVDYVDLLLIHWPNRAVPVQETLAAMWKLKTEGVTKTIGVSNFTVQHLENALQNLPSGETGDSGEDEVKIVNNQVEFHPSLYQKELKEYCDEKGILLTAYSPLAQGKDLRIPLIRELAQKYQRSEAQVILNWIISKGVVAIPKASKSEHIEDNYKTLEWDLDKEDVEKIDNLDSGNRLLNFTFSEFS